MHAQITSLNDVYNTSKRNTNANLCDLCLTIAIYTYYSSKQPDRVVDDVVFVSSKYLKISS